MSRYKPYPQYKDSGIEWLGQVPEHWSIFRMKIAIDIVQNGIWGEDPVGNEDDILCARVSDFDRNKHTISDNLITLRNVPENQRKSRIVRTGDLLIEKSGGGEQTAVGAVVQYTGEASIICSNFLAIVRCKKNFSERWLCYINEFLYSLGVNIRSIKQTTGIQNIDSAQYFSEKIPIPQLKDQIKISSHLDRETTRIETLIEKKSRFIELLQEKRQALLTQAVTKGLDPNANLKDSGVKWLGQVPEHWTVCHLQYVIINIEQGWSPECHSYPAEPGQWGILKSGCVNGGVYNNNENKALPEELSPKPQYEVKAGDILMSRASGSPELIGSVALVANTQDKLMLSDKIFRIQCAVKMNPAFFVNMLNSSALRSQIMHAISGAEGLANNLPQAHIKKFWVTCPPLSEQQTIVSILDQNIARIDALNTATQRSIELLKERRAALITAAVTGQIDLRDSATGEGEIP